MCIVSIQTISDLYAQEWNAMANVSSNGKQYPLLKDNLNLEKKYLTNVKQYYSRIIIYWIGNHQLDDGMIHVHH